ncbi:hypothetical protein, conserved in T. vivax [Trypanosoma vivax Y486]|uniref:Uncharacterized protein n=1 Tax=Trypanosoma vivax (strain Y486) TaxID=1055687 RepID=F9WQ49_TRYVY|nr:hypothetical protein, conserved in T. vivax [Trypanosoma vivax Y486]|eukprot:CCD19676.1 hypothetical protein, conserved in T. vivax [Trypanosoma vivax Y486]
MQMCGLCGHPKRRCTAALLHVPPPCTVHRFKHGPHDLCVSFSFICYFARVPVTQYQPCLQSTGHLAKHSFRFSHGESHTSLNVDKKGRPPWTGCPFIAVHSRVPSSDVAQEAHTRGRLSFARQRNCLRHFFSVGDSTNKLGHTFERNSILQLRLPARKRLPPRHVKWQQTSSIGVILRRFSCRSNIGLTIVCPAGEKSKHFLLDLFQNNKQNKTLLHHWRAPRNALVSCLVRLGASISTWTKHKKQRFTSLCGNDCTGISEQNQQVINYVAHQTHFILCPRCCQLSVNAIAPVHVAFPFVMLTNVTAENSRSPLSKRGAFLFLLSCRVAATVTRHERDNAPHETDKGEHLE